MSTQVKFSNGLYADYAALTTKDAGTLYFCTDTKQIFVGASEYTKGTKVLTAEPTSTTPGDIGTLYAYNGNLYMCTAASKGAYTYQRVANINDTAGTVTSVAFGEGLTGGDGTVSPITGSGTIQHAVPTGAAATTDGITNQTPDFGESFNVVGVATDKFGHATVTTHTVTLPEETAVTVETATGTAQTLTAGGTFTVVSEVEAGAADQSVKRTVTTYTLPTDNNTTYTISTGDEEGKIKVTPSEGSAYEVLVKGWEDLAKKSELSSVFKFKGTVATVDDLPKIAAVGDVYHVTAKSAEYVCTTASAEGTDAVYEELGSVIDLSDYAKSEDVIQRVTGATGNVAKFNEDGTLADTGYTLDTSVPADAQFTDTTYEEATTAIPGLMSADDKRKLDSISEGGQVNKLEGVQVNGADLTIDSSKKVNVTVATGSTDGSLAVNGTDVAVKGLADALGTVEGGGFKSVAASIQDSADSATHGETTIGAAITANTTAISTLTGSGDGSIAKAISTAIEGLDAEKSQTAGADGLALSITEVDGKITAISGSIAAGTYDAAGSAAGVQGSTTETVASVDAKVSAINNETTGILATAKKYTDDEIAKLDTTADVTIASESDGVVTIKAGVKEENGIIAQGTGADITLAKVATTGAAGDVSIADTAEKIAATTVEGALAEIVGKADANATAIGTLNGAVTADGSVLKMIKDNAKDATYDATHTIAQAIADAQSGATSASVVNVVKQESAEEGYAATYYITQNNVQVGSKINIPKDFLVKSGEVKTVTKADTPYEGAKVGDKYIDFVVNAKDASATDEHIYLPVNELVDVYTSGSAATDSVVVAISADNKITATLTDATISRAKIDADFEADIAALEGTHASDESGFKSVSTQIAEEAKNAEYKAAEGEAAAVSIKGALDDLYTQIGEGGGVATQIKTAIEALDATVSQTAGTDGLALQVVEVDGKLTSVTGSIAAETYDAYGAAAAVADTLGTVAGSDVATASIGAEGEDTSAIPTVGQVETYVTNALTWSTFPAQS